MSTASATTDEVHWKELDNEWAHVEILYRGDTSPGRVVDWGYSARGPNIGIVLEDPERGHVRVADAPNLEIGKRHLLAITSGDPSVLEAPIHKCQPLANWLGLYRKLHRGEEPAIERQYGSWIVKAGQHYLLMDLKFCPFCGKALS